MKLFGTILVGWFLCNFSEAVGDVINVPGDFPTIQLAVDSATDGDTILVAPGTYTENVALLLKGNIYLIGSGADVTTIDGGASGHVVNFNLTSGVISGFSITNSGDSMTYYAGIFTSQASIIIENNQIYENYGGISLSSNSDFVLRNNIIFDNPGFKCIRVSASEGVIHDNLLLNNGWYSIDCGNSSTSIVNNTIIGDRTGIALTPTDTQYVYNNIISGCENGLVLDTSFSNSFLILSHNNFWNNDNDYLYNAGSVPFIADSTTGDIYLDPKFEDTVQLDYRLKPTSPCINAGEPDTVGLSLSSMDLSGNSRISGLSIDIGAYEFQEPVNITTPSLTNQGDLYPNPMGESAFFRFITKHNDSYNIALYNSAGKIVKPKFIIHPKYIELQRDGLPSGLYYYQLIKDSTVHITGKLIML